MSNPAHMRALEQIIRSHPQFWSWLEAARDCAPPDWYIGAGALRSVVWDALHGYRQPTPCRDIDLAFFDPHDLRPARDQEVQAQLLARRPDLPWEATNQAAVHLWYPSVFGYAVEPLLSSVDGIGTWPETATSVGVRLQPDGALLIAAPCGLDDLLGMVLRRNPRRVSPAEFRRRLREKPIRQRWPRVQIIDSDIDEPVALC